MTWHPIASSADLSYRTTYFAQILGHEFVAWRADDDTLNLWENRCLHRGVRLTRGINDGAELTCQYHGWRYANQTAGCTYIPAHPADAPARTISNRTYPVAERFGLVWGSADGGGEIPDPGVVLDDQATPLRAVAVNAPSSMVVDAVTTYRFKPSGLVGDRPALPADWRAFGSDQASWDISVVDSDEFSVTLRSMHAGHETHVVLWVQPVDAHRSVIRGVLDTELEPNTSLAHELRLATLRHHDRRLGALRDSIEAQASLIPMPDPIDVEIVPVGVELAGMPEPTAGRSAPLRVQVARKWQAATEIVGMELTSIDGQLPTFHPGAHIDVHLPNGLVRQYSLTNGPGELGHYRIGIKLESDSRGGSLALHEQVRQGDVLAISAPRNNFTLRRDSERTVLLAGGIGLTPLLAMAQALDRSDLNVALHLFARGEEFLPFADIRESLRTATIEHLGLSPEETGVAIRAALGDYTESAQVYVCGPAPMIKAALEIADDLGWPEESVRFEHFANSTEIDDSSSFEVALARSAITFEVAGGETILDALRSNGVDMASSCEQGACGTCVATVIEGEVLHQDVYLSRSEHAAGDRIMTCVSRAAADRLVLDL